MKFCGMVTLYNPTQENINNIYEYLDELDKVYLIDNSSIDNSKLIKKNKKIMYIPNKENLGIATALNIACKQAIKDKFNWILTMDQDSKITKKVLMELIKYVKVSQFICFFWQTVFLLCKQLFCLIKKILKLICNLFF